MILIADSGSTKTSWYHSKGENHSEIFTTQGINPFFRTTEDIGNELQKELLPKTGTNIAEIHFYGAGIINKEKGTVVELALKQLFPFATVEVQSDLVAAARATLGKESGIACILGTGSNSCLFENDSVVGHVPPLGFILGDEGSGAVLGRKLVGDFLKGIMPKNLSEKFRSQFPVSYSGFLENVYKKEKPNKFLAGFVPFLKENIDEEYCKKLVGESLDEFIERNIKQYAGYEKHRICFVGSVAFYFQDQLKSGLRKNGLKLDKIMKEPLQGLIQYHL